MKAKEFRNLGYSFRSGFEAGLQMNFGKEKDMKETNLQHYKEQLKGIFNKHYTEPKEMIKAIKACIGETITYDFQSCTDAILNWMAQPYEEKILNEEERRFVGEAIKPFREIVGSIRKELIDDEGDGYFLWLDIINEKFDVYHAIVLPTEIMCKGMELGKDYTLKELGL
nr:MAG TPA: hypothetical protein [Caudoviricetes sp.]